MKKAILIGFAIFFMMAGQAIAWWPPTSDTKIVPQNPTSSDVVVITLSGSWDSGCIPYASAVSVMGNDIYFDVIASQSDYCITVIAPWERTESVGYLLPGTYAVYARLLGHSLVPETYTWITEFSVTADYHVGTVYYVDTIHGDDDNDGLSEATAFATIQKGIDATKRGDTVIVAPGTYSGDGNTNLDFNGKAITVRSENGPGSTVIDCENDGRGFYFHTSERADSVLEGFTITNGDAPFGGAIFCTNASPTIINCIISGNMANSGGGIACINSNPTVTNCTITGNTARYGYGYGGGIYCDQSSPTITNCTISGNMAASGGAIYCEYGNLTITNSQISQNSAEHTGGGISCHDGNAVIANCTITGNSTRRVGGAIFCEYGSSTTITNCTISGNSAGLGGGIISWKSSPNITNCIIWQNTANKGAQLYASSELSYSCIQDWSGGGTGNIDADPCFVEPGYWDTNGVWVEGDYHLLEDSPCIDTGDPNYVPEPNETDLDGRPRIINGTVDMGAYEFNYIPVADAGPGQTVYAWIDGIAEVTLDGTGSYDDDGHPLTYNWRWTVDGNTYDTNGVDPSIELPVGEHIIELIVNDGIDDSEPDEVVITVIEPIESRLWIFPRTINRNSRQPKIMARLRLPEGVTKDQIDNDQPFMLYPGGIEAMRRFVFQHRRRGAQRTSVFAFFDKAELMNTVTDNGRVELQVVGQLETGQYFYGSDIVRIIDRRRRSWRRR